MMKPFFALNRQHDLNLVLKLFLSNSLEISLNLKSDLQAISEGPTELFRSSNDRTYLIICIINTHVLEARAKTVIEQKQ